MDQNPIRRYFSRWLRVFKSDVAELTIRRGVGTRGIDEATALNGFTLVAPLTSKMVSLSESEPISPCPDV